MSVFELYFNSPYHIAMTLDNSGIFFNLIEYADSTWADWGECPRVSIWENAEFLHYLQESWHATVVRSPAVGAVGVEFKSEQDKLMFVLAWS